MWKPANSLSWQSESLCSKKENKPLLDSFFSNKQLERDKAKNLCFQCPVRKECLQWALEHRQIWGVWGGREESEIRRTLSVSYLGEETRRKRYPNCPMCIARPYQLEVSIVKLEGSGRWGTAKIITCKECNFSWKSRTSANAVEMYHAQRADKKEKSRLRREKIKAKKDKAKKSNAAKASLRPLLGVVQPSSTPHQPTPESID